MNQQKLIKELGLKSTMKIRDYYHFILYEDMAEEYKIIKQHCDVECGDSVFIIALKAPKLKRRLLKGVYEN